MVQAIVLQWMLTVKSIEFFCRKTLEIDWISKQKIKINAGTPVIAFLTILKANDDVVAIV